VNFTRVSLCIRTKYMGPPGCLQIFLLLTLPRLNFSATF